MTPKVLVGCPTYDGKAYCLRQYAERVKILSYPDYDVLLVDNSENDDYSRQIGQYGLEVVRSPRSPDTKQTIANARNVLRTRALGYDYLLSLEQDVIPPIDVIERLIAHKKQVVSGVYTKKYEYSRDGKTLYRELPVLWARIPGRPRHAAQVDKSFLLPPRLAEVIIFGLGCVLIHRSVLETIVFHVAGKGFDDATFSNDLILQRIPAYADTGVICGHHQQIE